MARAQKQNLHFTKQTFGSVCLKEASMFFCILLSVILLLMDATNSKKMDAGKMALQNAFAPIFSYTSKFANSMDDFFLNFNTVSALNKEKQGLLEENANMQMWRNKALRFEAENQSLKELLKFDNSEDYTFISAQIAIDNSASFNKNVIVKAKGLEKNQSVVSSHGLVGRILEVGDNYSSVLLITDVNSKVPAIIERTRVKTITSGRNTKSLSLSYIPEEADITIGDRVITSGDGSVFLPGLLIGTISYIEGDNVKVNPATDFDRMEFISVLKEGN
jgi:rod shape-determining protein MreC